ncbi:MAG: AAA family ATPase, partial [candidate division WOR-3 bacterium]
MAQPPWMADEAWRIVQTAKAAAISEGENEISIRHLFQGCTLEARDVVSATLAEIGIEEKQIERYLNSVSGDIRGGDAYLGVALPVSQQAESVLIKARGIARDYPAEEHSRVAPVHLWVSLCDTVGELESWLVKQGWSQDVLKGLRKAAEKQLPLVKSAPSSALRESERAVLEKLCTRNLTELARRGRLSPAYGMDAVTWQAVHCLLRRDKRSVVFTGDAGVGKTKLVEDLALRIVTGEIPELAGCEIFELDLALLTRGTQFAGSRAERWAQLAEVLRAHPDSVILFIDELHTIVGLPLEGQAMDLS